MSHISGYGGTMTYSSTSTDQNFDALDALNPIALQSWSITQETDNFKVFTKGEAWKTSFATGSRWRGTATYILDRPDPDGILAADGRNMEIRGDDADGGETGDNDAEAKTFDGTFLVNADIIYTGEAWVTSMSPASPLDAEATMTVEFRGKGALTLVGA